MQILSTRDSAEHYTGNVGVPREGQRFFERDEGKCDEIGEEVCAEEEAGEICRKEAVEEVGEGVVVVGGEGVGGRD